MLLAWSGKTLATLDYLSNDGTDRECKIGHRWRPSQQPVHLYSTGSNFASRIWGKDKCICSSTSPCSALRVTEPTISLRLLALILCSNCSNTFNKVLTPTWRHTVKLLFATSGHHFSLLNMFHGWSKHFTSRYDPSTPFPFTPTPFPFTP